MRFKRTSNSILRKKISDRLKSIGLLVVLEPDRSRGFLLSNLFCAQRGKNVLRFVVPLVEGLNLGETVFVKFGTSHQEKPLSKLMDADRRYIEVILRLMRTEGDGLFEEAVTISERVYCSPNVSESLASCGIDLDLNRSLFFGRLKVEFTHADFEGGLMPERFKIHDDEDLVPVGSTAKPSRRH